MGTDKTDPLKPKPKSSSYPCGSWNLTKDSKQSVRPCPLLSHCGENFLIQRVSNHGSHRWARIRLILWNQIPSLPLIRAGRAMRGQIFFKIPVRPCPLHSHCGQNFFNPRVFNYGSHRWARIRLILWKQIPSLPLIRAGREIRGKNSSKFQFVHVRCTHIVVKIS